MRTMKITSVSLGVAVTLALLWLNSCNNDNVAPKTGEIQFSFTANNSQDNSGRIAVAGEPAFIMYTIRNQANEVSSDKVAVFKFGSSYISERQKVTAGNKVLLEYYVLNASSEIIYAAVMQGSPFASLVSQTLPMEFQVTKDQATLVSPDVLPVTAQSSPENFGYVKWSFNIAAKAVKFILPIRPELAANFRSATLKITQGTYEHSEPIIGTPSTQLYAETLVKPGVPVSISLVVNADNIYSRGYRKFLFNEQIISRTSISQLEYTQTLSDLTSDSVVVSTFEHKIGDGWNFRFAEITTNAVNGSWIKMRYENGEYCNRYVTLMTNASEVFEHDQNMGRGIYTDKVIWSQPTWYKRDDGVIWYYGDQNIIKWAYGNFGQPVCANGVCTFTAELNELSMFSAYEGACSTNQWIAFDALTLLSVKFNGQTSQVTSYFLIEKDAPNAFPYGAKQSEAPNSSSRASDFRRIN